MVIKMSDLWGSAGPRISDIQAEKFNTMTEKLIATANVNVAGRAYRAGEEIKNATNRDASYLVAIGKANRSAIQEAREAATRRKPGRPKKSEKTDESDGKKDSGATSE